MLDAPPPSAAAAGLGPRAQALAALAPRRQAVPRRGVPDLRPYDEARLLTETAWLVDWYLPAAGAPPSPGLRDEYLELWRRVLPQASLPTPTLVLRDYHVD